ncbi:HAD family hydrolase [Streptomyces roseoverticillatus]|uniref:HAD family hydrolase n=1 Tax=Streptomyces roseoverticillatus TaxID=66429 RepID=UPI001F28BDC4|nr:HAD-IA family hydrolase [Streptomyces roseoverticillatus]
MALFDLDDTLISRRGALADWIRQFRDSHGLDDASELKLHETLSARAYPEDFERIRQQLRLTEPAVQLWQAYVAGIAERMSPERGVIEGLTQMRAAGWALVVVTNGAADIQRAKLERTGLLGSFDALCISGEIGVRKPSKEIFEEAGRRCGLPLAGWMVGDNPITDVGGGRAAGLRTVWISGGQQWPAGVRSPDRVAPDASEAIAHLLAWSAECGP